MNNPLSRRTFVKTAAAAGLAASLTPAFAARLSRGSTEAINVGVIGCGGRGTGAAWNLLEADPATRIVALGDLFEHRVRSSLDGLREFDDAETRVKVVPEAMFHGLDAYEKVLSVPGVQLVVLATPPGFRPQHFEAAVAAGKHVFMEKPVAVDPAGVRTVLAAAQAADAANLSVVAGTQRRHERCYLDLIQRIRDGELGTIHAGSCAWNQGGLWVNQREPGESDIAWQCRNWLYFCWLSGDHIVEQHIHNLDVMNWALGEYPVRCTGLGGRQVRIEAQYGHIFDHFAVEYEYASGAIVSSQCRQIDGCDGRVDELLIGSRGRSLSRPGSAHLVPAGASSPSWTSDADSGNPYVQEHVDLLASIRNAGPRLNDAQSVAKSTLTAIMGRMSAYTGKSVTWDQAMHSTLSLMPENLTAADLHARRLPEWAVPVPGRTPLV